MSVEDARTWCRYLEAVNKTGAILLAYQHVTACLAEIDRLATENDQLAALVDELTSRIDPLVAENEELATAADDLESDVAGLAADVAATDERAFDAQARTAEETAVLLASREYSATVSDFTLSRYRDATEVLHDAAHTYARSLETPDA